ncbi:DUF948 domain-containing protein [Halobacillus locisalis]|uniref:DUF948 domain-containing protein n=1 Tax=Halobacillus locisalis TaxID=220753 RepID=UPI0031B61E4F
MIYGHTLHSFQKCTLASAWIRNVRPYTPIDLERREEGFSIIEWSISLAAIAFIILVVYLIMTLRKLMATLSETKETLSDARQSVNTITNEAEELMQEANDISVDVKGKMEAVDPLIESVHDVGDMLHDVTSSMKRTALQKENRKTVHTQDTEDKQENKPVRIKLK